MEILIVLLVVASAFIALVGGRRSWVRKQCAHCRLYVPAQASKCSHCHEWIAVVALMVACIAPGVEAQEVTLVSCPAINFFGPACEEGEPVADAPVALPPPAPLFPRSTLSPHIPPLLVTLLNDPTAANADRYLDWEAQKQQATEDVQALLLARRLLRKGPDAPR